MKWLSFSVGFAIVPIGLDSLYQLNFGKVNSITLDYLVPAPSTYLIGLGVAASGLGELWFDYRSTAGVANAGFLAMSFFSLIVVLTGGFMYAINKPQAAAGAGLPLAYLATALIVGGVTVYVSARS